MGRLPNVRAKEIIKALQKAGFEVQRQKEAIRRCVIHLVV
jgi:predicted RNA binding protein YcfA (HicA-like mRNA interferase family)